VLWTVPGTTNLAPLICRNGTIVTQGTSGAQAVDAATGAVLWNRASGGIRLSAASADGTLYGTDRTVSPNVSLVAVDGATGATKWTLSPGPYTISGLYFPPIVGKDGTVYTFVKENSPYPQHDARVVLVR
jgi:outer membrane protein assembly factor BamB